MKTFFLIMSLICSIATAVFMVDILHIYKFSTIQYEDKDLLWLMLGMVTSTLFLTWHTIEEQNEKIHMYRKVVAHFYIEKAL